MQQSESSYNLLIDKLQGWLDAFISNLPNIVLAIIVLIVSYFVARFVNKIVSKLVGKQVKQDSISSVVGRITAVLVFGAGLFLALSVLNLSQALKTLITGAGVAGLVVGLALQGTLSNTVSGIVLSFRKRIQIGNWIETNGFAGEVIDINLKEFILKEADNNMVVIPNKMILENPLKNYSLTTKMRVMVECGVGYESDLEVVENITKNAIANSFKQISDADEVEFYYTEFGGSSINFLCRFWIDAENSIEKIRAKSKAIMKIKEAFNKEDINIPFPIRTLQFDNKLSLANDLREETNLN